jgi:hypothetical protein
VNACNSGTQHAAARCLLGLHERANGTALDGEDIQAWLEWEWEATHWRVPVDISRAELEGLVERSVELLKMPRHRPLHGSVELLYSCVARPSLAALALVRCCSYTEAHLYPGPQDVVEALYAFHGALKPRVRSRGSGMQNLVCRLRRTPLPRTRVNNGSAKVLL